MLLLKSSGVPYSNFQLFEFSPQKKNLKHNFFYQLLLISISHTDIPIFCTLFEDSDLLTC